MGTRGSFGFKTERDYFMCFNPMDSNPSSLGEYWFRVIKKKYDLEHMKEALHACNTITLKLEGKKLTGDLTDKPEEFLRTYDEISRESDTGIFDAVYEGRINIFLNDKEFMKNTLFCEWIYYYDYETKKFVVIDNHNEKEHSINLENTDWQKFFKMLELD